MQIILNPMVNNIKYFFVICIIIFSCKPENNKKFSEKDVIIYIQLPDTIQRKDSVLGVLYYESVFDTIQLMKDEKRYVFLYLNKTKIPTKSFKEFLTKDRDTFVTIKDGSSIIPISDISFDSIGNYFLDGYIIDQLWLNKMRVENNNEKIRIPTIETKITHSIYVN